MSLKKIWPYLILIFLCLAFFYKVFLGFIPLPADLITGGYYPWLDYKWGNPVGVSVKNAANITDAVSIEYPLRSMAMNLLKKGELPLWNPYMFTGYPIIANQETGLFFPTIIFYLFLSTEIAWTIQIIFQVFLSSFFMFLLARHLGLNKLPSIFAAIAFGFGGFSMIRLEWNCQTTASAFLPLLILSMDKFLKSGKIKWGILLSISLALQIFAGFLPVVIFSLATLAIWFLFNFSVKNIPKLLFFVFAGITLTGILLLPNYELFKDSQRLYEVINTKEAFIPFESLVTLLAPDFFGNPATGNFWGIIDHLNTTAYTGIITAILAIITVFSKTAKKEIKALFIIFLLTFFVSINNPFSEFLYNLGIWGGKSMTMNRSFFIINFCMALLGAISLQNISKLTKKVFLATIIVLAGLIFLTFYSFIYKNINPNLEISLRNLVLPIILTLSFLSLISISKLFKVREIFLQLCIIALLIVELFRFGWKYNPFTPLKYLYPETAITNFLKSQPNTRFIAEQTILPPNMWVPYNLQSVTGYNSFYPKDIAKIIAVANSGNPNSTPQTKNGLISNFNSPLLALTGTNFILVPKRDNKRNIKPDGLIDQNLHLDSANYKKAFEYGSIVVLENKNTLKRAYLTAKTTISKSENETLEKMLDANFPFNKLTITEDVLLDGKEEDLPDPIYRQLSNNHTQILTNSPVDSILVVLDNFYPGWNATIDSKPVKIHRVNYTFRGILTPKGEHTIDFYYSPNSLKIGAIISILTGFALLGIYLKSKSY